MNHTQFYHFQPVFIQYLIKLAALFKSNKYFSDVVYTIHIFTLTSAVAWQKTVKRIGFQCILSTTRIWIID